MSELTYTADEENDIVPVGKYSVIYGDPAWLYSDKCNAGERGVSFKYKEMKTEDICSIDVASISADDCGLFMWSTMTHLPDALQVMKAWGFEYKTVAFVWVKTPRGKRPVLRLARDYLYGLYNKTKWVDIPYVDLIKLHWGMGSMSRANPELVLYGKKGKPKRMHKGVHSVVISQLEDIHSRKPGEVRNRICRLMGDVPKVELFATEKVPGWDAIGNQIDGRDILDVIGRK